MSEFKKRETAYKLRVGNILQGTPIVEDIPQEMPSSSETMSSSGIKERFRYLELGDKRIYRVNVVANIIEKYISEGEKKYASLTLDDASGQIKLKVFGEDCVMFNDLIEGDTVIIIGVLKSYNREIYIIPEIIRKVDSSYLLVRKLELEKSEQKTKPVAPEKKLETREQIMDIIKNNQDTIGVSTEEIILKIKTVDPETINSEIIRLIEDGIVYEPRPGRVRWLG